jgi:hypothetical protein
MDEYVTLTYTAYQSKMYGINRTPGEIINYLMEKKLQQLAYKVGATSINMPRVLGSSITPGTMGGRLRYLKNTAGVSTVNGGAAQINASLLNQAFEAIRAKGGAGSTIVAHPVQAKRFSALNTGGNNPQIMRDDTTAGQYVNRFVTDFGDMADIVYSYDMDKNAVAIIDPSKITLRPFLNDGFRDMDATTPGSRTLNRRITGQYSLEFKNATTSHALITNILV